MTARVALSRAHTNVPLEPARLPATPRLYQASGTEGKSCVTFFKGLQRGLQFSRVNLL